MASWNQNSLAWLWRLAVLTGILAALWLPPNPTRRPPEPDSEPETILLETTYPVETVDPRVCMHTRLTDEAIDQNVLQTFQLVREMGASSVVEFLPWGYVETAPGVYDWTHPDLIIRHAEYQGLNLIARMGFVPFWLRPEDQFTNGNYLSDEAVDYFAAYVGAFVKRYAGRIHTIIIWNEPNLAVEWSGHPPNPIAYTRLLQKAYTAAHAANPEIIVLGGALAPTTEKSGSPYAWDDVDFLNEMYQAGAKGSFDGLAVHVYGFTQPPEAEPAPDQLNFRRIELLREIMLRYGDDKPTYITESGWNDHPRWINAVRPGQRIQYTINAYRYAAEHEWDWLKTICLWAFRYPLPTNRYPDYFTYVAQDFAPKPIYEALQAYARGWEAPVWLSDEP